MNRPSHSAYGAFRCIAGLVMFSLMATSSAFASDAKSQPNIIVIMADDLGYGDVSCNGATAIQTPNIDALAASGLRFTSGYCSASTCTPTRYSFLTGTYAFRQKGTGIAPPNSPAIIQSGTTTIASLLKEAGYTTAVIGKWHLGLGEKKGPDWKGGPDWNGDLKPGPLEIGFDRCFLLPTTNDRVPQVFVENHRVKNLDPADPSAEGQLQAFRHQLAARLPTPGSVPPQPNWQPKQKAAAAKKAAPNEEKDLSADA